MQTSLFDPVTLGNMPPESTPLENRIFHVLQDHRGKDTAISMDALANLCTVSTREIQEAVHHMIVAYRVPIGSTSSAARPGYYLVIDREEADQVYRSLKGRALSILKRASVIRGISNADLVREIATEIELDV